MMTCLWVLPLLVGVLTARVGVVVVAVGKIRIQGYSTLPLCEESATKAINLTLIPLDL